jgi:hypothetical protein
MDTLVITRIEESGRQLLTAAGFTIVETGRREFKCIVPADCKVIRARPRYDLEDNKVFYGDTLLLSIYGKNAAYDFSMYATVEEENVKAYIEKALSNETGQNVQAAKDNSIAATEAEQQRQLELSQTNPDAYLQEGLFAMASARDEDGNQACVMQ